MMMTTAAANLYVSGDSVAKVARVPPLASPRRLSNGDRPKIPSAAFKEEEEEEDSLPPRTREPLVSVTCSCSRRRPLSAVRPCSRTGRGSFDGKSEDDSSSDSEEEGVAITQLLRAFRLYEARPPGSKSMSALRNLIASFGGERVVQEEQLEQLLSQLHHSDQGLREAALLTIGQLCNNPSNIKILLQENIVRTLMGLLSVNSEEQTIPRELVAQVLQKILEIETTADDWMEQMLTHVDFLVECMSTASTLAEKLAFVRLVRTLSKYEETCLILLSRHLAMICELKKGCNEMQEEYCAILTQSTMHMGGGQTTDFYDGSVETCLETLMLPPCSTQSKAAELLAAFAAHAEGHRAIIQHEVVPYIMSAVLDSNCRRVRAAGLHAIGAMLSNSRSSNAEKAMLNQLDRFYHSHEDSYTQLDSARSEGDSTEAKKMEKAFLNQRTLGDLTSSLVEIFCREARIQFNKKTMMAEDVKLMPTIDTDVIVLEVLRHCVTSLGSVASLKTNGVKVKVDLADSCEGAEEELQETRKRMEKRNHRLATMLVEKGALCVFDLLHVYTAKLGEFLSNERTKTTQAKQAWTVRPTSASATRAGRGEGNPLQQFEDGEVKLIKALLHMVSVLTWCSCECSAGEATTQEKIAEKLKKYQTRDRKYTIESLREAEVLEAEKSVNERRNNSELSTGQQSPSRTIAADDRSDEEESEGDEIIDLTQFDDPCETNVTVESIIRRYERLFQEKTKLLTRQMRIHLYEGGVLQCVGPWLASGDHAIMDKAGEILCHMMQPLEESLVPLVSSFAHKKKFRPVSAMTPKEREKALNMAVNQMSSKMRGFIREALGTTTEESPSDIEDQEAALIVANGGIQEHSSNGPPETTSETDVPDSGVVSVVTQQDTESSAGYSVDTKSCTSDLYMDSDEDEEEDIELCFLQGTDDRGNQLKNLQPLRNRPQSAKVTVLSVTHDESVYDEFARGPSRPQSAKPILRPSSARAVAVTQPDTWNNVKGKTSNLTKPSNPHNGESLTPRMRKSSSQGSLSRLDKIESWQDQLRSTKSSMAAGSSSKVSFTKCQPLPKIKNKEPAVTQMRVRFSGKSKSSQKNNVVKPAKPVLVKPSLDKTQPVAYQCQRHLVKVCCGTLLQLLFEKNIGNKSLSLSLLEGLLKHAQGDVHMMLSEYGIVPKLVDFLRVNDDDTALEIYGLTIVRQLVKQDVRLKQLFHKHGGTQLLMAMVSYTEGPLREEVCNTLKVVSRGSSGQITKAGSRMVQSAPPGRSHSAPDVWDHIMMRWRDEDRVRNVLRQDRYIPT